MGRGKTGYHPYYNRWPRLLEMMAAEDMAIGVILKAEIRASFDVIDRIPGLF